MTTALAEIYRAPNSLVRAGEPLPSIGIADSIRRTFLAHLPLYILNAGFFSASWALLACYGRPLSFSPAFFFLEFVLAIACLWLLTQAVVDVLQLWREGAPSGLAGTLVIRLWNRLLKGDRAGNGFHAVMTLTPMMIAFTAVKENIGLIRSFAWDPTLAQWDRVLGFGRMPAEILQPLLGHPWITIALNFNYDLWFFVMFGILIWQGFSARCNVLRMQFLLSFCLAWIVGGSILAIGLSSAGPCYYDRLYAGTSPFLTQMAYLRDVGPKFVWSLTVQDDLWNSYKTGVGVINGISAMPSLHVGVAVLLALFGWRTNRGLGIALSLFAALILLGSIHLLWHYAVDGIAGGAVGLLCWSIAGVAVRRWFLYVRMREETSAAKIVTTSQPG